MCRFRRTGFTLIEVLVVVVIIGLLLALLLPAVQQTRETARRATCASHLKNIGLAIHHHAEAHNTFPPGMTTRPLGASLHFQTLPFLERTALYHSINIAGDISGDNKNITVSMLRPAIFLCPSDASRASVEAANATNYAGNAGKNTLFGEGVFIGRPLAARDITDGLSHTAGATEWIVGTGTRDQPSRLGSIYRLKRVFTSAPVDFEEFRRICAALDPADIQQFLPFKGQFWLEGGLDYTQYNHTLPPNWPSCGALLDTDATTAGSLHPGGAHVLTMDGGVHFVKDAIDPQVWIAVGTRSGGEAVGESPF